jgi:hypothetical protein
MTVGGWGSGSCSESNTNAYAGNYSLKITPKDLYAGGRIDFSSPIDLTSSFNSPDAYLQLVTRFGSMQPAMDTWAIGVSAPTASVDTSKTARQPKRIRVMLVMEGGQAIECQVDASWFELTDEGWLNISFPLAALKGKLDLPEYKLKRLVITGDGTEPFYIGEIRAVRDSTLLEANAGEEKEVSKNYYVVFHGFAQAGASPMKYSWDFDKKNGIQEEGVGEVVYHRFNKAGDFIATLTVSDPFGLKKPATSTITVKVNE